MGIIRHWILVHGVAMEVPLWEFARWFETADRMIDYTVISHGVAVSTVFLGTDHNWDDWSDPQHVPWIYETMIFGGPHNFSHWRYATMGEAKRGHWIIVEALQAGRTPL